LAEELMVLRDIELVRLTACPVHFMHLSTRRSIALVAAARREGLPVTCEVAPHHFTLDEGLLETYDPLFKVHPPLRGRDEVEGLRSALVAGEIDAVATDHAPPASELTDLPFDEAPSGMLNLEHAASLTYEALGDDPNAQTFFSLLSRTPARIAQLRHDDERVNHSGHGGALRPGEDANVVVFDPAVRWRVERSELASRATNTPYDQREMRGRVRSLVVRGALVVSDGTLT
jgi:dihydroorotase